jgi:inhibitor of cysteine peptidase
MHRTRLVDVALLCFATVIAAQALQSSPPGSSTKSTIPAVTIADRDNGTDVDLTAGGMLIVKLPSNPSTGYSWAVAGDSSPLKLQKTSFVQKSHSRQMVGSAGTQVLRFGANSVGMGNLTVVYRRSWEYNVPPVKTFTVRGNVR